MLSEDPMTEGKSRTRPPVLLVLRVVAAAAISMALVLPVVARAQDVRLSIEKGFGEKVRIAVPLFPSTGAGEPEPEGIRDVLLFDLSHSGYFDVVENLEFVDEAERDDRASGRIDFAEWLALGAEILVKGKFQSGLSEFWLEVTVHDLEGGRAIFAKRYTSAPDGWRAAVHALSDEIVKRLTGEDGIAGTRIAFVSNATGTKEVYVMDYDGANRRRLTRESQMAIYPGWFPSGERIAYTSYRGPRQELHAVDVSSGATSRLTAFPGLNAFASVSPDGREILMTLSRDGNPEIYRLRSDGTSARRLTYGRSTESSPCWSPDGRRIAFVSDRSGRPQIHVMNSTGGTGERVTFQGYHNTTPEWSPRGDLIAYTSQIEGVFQICTVDVETGEVTRLTTDRRHKEDPSWAPDGRHIVYSAKSGGKSDLYLLDIYEKEPVKLTSGAGDYLSPAWSR
ncbi:MAG: Tol-Pal system beta propeller repeat protein TolB [Candidatus Eisenbacteria bacterium]|nr:Tol-Pal system beta propeller repeat protein TolB [Candidatus Eisenbacteria bacterium]